MINRQKVECLCWYLNHRDGETIEIEHIASQLDMEWGEVYNTIHSLKRLQYVIPVLETGKSNVTIKNKNEHISSLFDGSFALAFFLFHTALSTDGLGEPLDKEKYKETLEQYDDEIVELEQMGWVEQTEETIKLTPTGIGAVGSQQSRHTANVPQK